MKATLINNLTGERIPVTATSEHSSSSYGHAVWVDSKNNAYLQVGLEHMQSLYSIEDKIDEENAEEYMAVELGSNEYIVRELAKFLRDETLEECPINIVSRENIEGEDAELVRFTFGEYKHSCVAIVFADGTTYTPSDWQTPLWEDEEWKITDSEEWMDCYFRQCIMHNGMPRLLVM